MVPGLSERIVQCAASNGWLPAPPHPAAARQIQVVLTVAALRADRDCWLEVLEADDVPRWLDRGRRGVQTAAGLPPFYVQTVDWDRLRPLCPPDAQQLLDELVDQQPVEAVCMVCGTVGAEVVTLEDEEGDTDG